MTTALMTSEDIHKLKTELLEDFKQIINEKKAAPKKYLRSSEVKAYLNLSTGTLQNLRNNGTIPYTKIGSIIYYDLEVIQNILESNKIDFESP